MEARLASKPGTWQRMRPALGVAFAAVGLSAVAFGLAAGMRELAGAALPVSALGALLSLAAIALVARTGRKGVGLAAGSITLLAWVPVLFLGGLWALSAPIATTNVTCGTAEVGLVVLVPLAVVIAWTILAPVATVAALAGRRVRRVAEALAVAATVAGLVVAGLAVAAARWPAPDAYLSTLRTVPLAQGTQAVGPWAIDYGTPVALQPVRDPPMACDVTLQRRAHSRTVSVDAPRGACPELYAHVDDARDVLVVDAHASPPAEDTAVFIAVGDDLTGREAIVPGDLPRALGPPRGWAAGGVAGVLVACAALAGAWRVRRRAGSLQNARDAVHAGGGWVTLDGTPRHAPELAGAPPGPVLVVPVARGGGTAYRDDGGTGPVRATPGTKAEALAGAESVRLGLAAFALAAVLLTQAVLWAARVRGLT